MKTLSKCILLFLAAFLLLPTLLSAQHPQDTLKAKKPGIVAHRGFHRFEGSAENSISSMQHAFAHDFEGTEFDVQLTKDDVAIVFHDSKMQGHVICDTPFDTLRQLQAFTLKNGETVPTLDEFLEACSIAINIHSCFLRSSRCNARNNAIIFSAKSSRPSGNINFTATFSSSPSTLMLA